MKIAVVGAGIAGVTAALVLSKKHEVSLFEKNNRLGGHTNTIEVKTNTGKIIPIDTGFIVLNDCNYGVLHNVFSILDVDVRWSDMSFSYHNKETGYYYAGTNIFGLFPEQKILFSKNHWNLLLEIFKFCLKGQSYIKYNKFESNETLGQFLDRFNFSKNIIENYLLPMGSAIWSVPQGQILEFPVESFLKFFKNHGLLSITERPRWQTVVGGSYSYLKKFEEKFQGKIIKNREVVKLYRVSDKILIEFNDNTKEEFDKVVLACHADQVLNILDNPSNLEREIFSKWKYQENEAILHTDDKIMPPYRQSRPKYTWASWNYHVEKVNHKEHSHATLTYYMNLLQGLDSSIDYFVSLNCVQSLDPNKIIKIIKYNHPIYSKEAISTHQEWLNIQSQGNNVYYCGSYWGEGFHEDAARSGAQVALLMGITI